MLGVNRTHVQAMKRGYVDPETGQFRRFAFTHGLRTKLDPAVDWLAANPNFRERLAYMPRKPKTAPTPNASPAGKSDAP